MADDDDVVEARPIETDEPSDLMSTLAAGIEAAAATARAAAETAVKSAETGQEVVGKLAALEANVDRATRRRTVLIVATSIVGVLVVALGVAFIVLLSNILSLQEQGEKRDLTAAADRLVIIEALQEIKDCTTPEDQTSDCQKRLSVQARARSLDNLRASVAVGTCLRAQVSDVAACSAKEFQRLKDAGKP